MVVIRITCVELFMSISFWKILYGTAKSVILLGLSRILQEKKVKYIYQQIWFNVLRFLNVFIQCWNLNYFVWNICYLNFLKNHLKLWMEIKTVQKIFQTTFPSLWKRHFIKSYKKCPLMYFLHIKNSAFY